MSFDENEGKSISRRSFLKGAAVTAVGVATVGILEACSSGDEKEKNSSTTASKSSSSSTIDWVGKAPEIAESDIKKTIKADVVVVGGGHAGLSAAWYAAKNGASVSVIELQKKDKYKWNGEQIGHFNSEYLINQGLGPYDLGEVVSEFMRCTANRANAVLIQKYVHNSGRMFDTFYNMVPKDSPYLNCLNVHQAAHNPSYPIERSGYKTWSGCAQFRGKIFEEPFQGVAANSQIPFIYQDFIIPDAEKNGAKWYYGQEATVLVKDGDKVVGCIAKSDSGYTKFLANKAVILSTGDFSGNVDMCNALITEVAEQAERRGQDPKSILGFSQRSGIGHKMGVWAGGHMETSPRASMTMGGAGGPFGMTPFLNLNCRGERFMNEDIAIGQAPVISRQPIGKICVVFDNNWPKICEKNSVNHGNPDYGVPEFIAQATEDMSHVLDAGKEGYAVRSMAITERMGSTVFGANTLEELADMLGYSGEDKETFLASIKRYNELCKKGLDEDFGKPADVLIPIENAPFYGIASSNEQMSVGLVTLSGLETDNDMNVLDDEGKGIEGLYAVGNCLGGRYAVAYATPVAGNSIGMAMTHGMLLGEYVAKL